MDMEWKTQTPSPPARETDSDARFLIGLISVFAFLWLVMPLIYPPSSRWIYIAMLPISQLGTFVHEMGHGLGAIFTGGHFHWLQIEMMRGGAAITSGGWPLFVLLGGLLGPAMAGALLMYLSTRVKRSRPVLAVLCFLQVAGMFFMIKPMFIAILQPSAPLIDQWRFSYLSSLIIPTIGLLLTVKICFLSERIQRRYLQFLGVIMCLAGFSSNSYIFTYRVLSNGGYSDARMVAGMLWSGPETVPFAIFVVVATVISILNIALMLTGAYVSIRSKRPKANRDVAIE